MKGFKKLIAVMLLSLTLFNSIFASYSMTVQAASAIPATMTALEALLSLFGLEIGLGNQYSFWSQQETLNDIFNGAYLGEVVTFSNYGEVDFSNSESINNWLTWCADYNDYALGNISPDSPAYDSVCDSVAKALDKTSYANSGTSATNAMHEYITEVQSVLDEETEESWIDVQESFKVWYTLGSNGNVSGPGDDNGEDPKLDWKKYKILMGLVAASLISDASKIKETVTSLFAPEETTYTDYSTAFEDADGFSGYEMNSDGTYKVSGTIIQLYDDYSYTFIIEGSSLSPPCGYLYGDNGIELGNVSNSSFSTRSFTYTRETRYFDNPDEVYTRTGNGHLYGINGGYSLNIPIFSSLDSLNEYISTKNDSLIINKADTSAYPNFKTTVGTAKETVSVPLSSLMNTNPSPDHLPEIVVNILQKTNDTVGTPDYVPDVEAAIQEASGTEPDTNPDTDTSTDYTGILGKILNAIERLPELIWDFFFNPIGTIIENWQELLDFLAACWVAIQYFFATVTDALSPSPIDGNSSGSGNGDSSGSVNILNGLLLLIYILFVLLRIFLHLLEFIINIFKIPAAPGFITGDFAVGFEYIKSVQLSPLDISIYDFLMGLIHIMVLFGVVKVLKKHIDRIHV